MEEEVAQRLVGRDSFHSTIHIFFKCITKLRASFRRLGPNHHTQRNLACYLFLTFPALHRFVIFSGCSSTDHVRKDQL